MTFFCGTAVACQRVSSTSPSAQNDGRTLSGAVDSCARSYEFRDQ
jgi:hypothetical protein